jgi:2-dehydro-3-deoxyphosphogluconate aldolase/(4S)-4-hydroxy-2-oxoglutarate aldolase
MGASEQILRTRDAILEAGVILCVRLGADAPLLGACGAAVKGGLRVLELTLTTPGALDAIRTLAREGDSLVGAGTVLTRQDVADVAEAGGRFVMSPVFDAGVVDAAHACGLLAVPGAATPSEILTARRHGAHLVKVFPAGALGGPDYLRALRGPLPDPLLVPTSGPDSGNLSAYVDAGASAVGVGAEVFPPDFNLASVEEAARRIAQAWAAARSSRPLPASASRVRVLPVRVGDHVAEGLVCTWENGQYVAIVAPRGLVACGIFDPAVCEHFGFAVAMAHGTPEAPLTLPTDVLRATVDSVSSSARALGVEPGMSGAEALTRLF